MTQFVPEHATVLYEKSLRVRVQRADREDVTELLKVRLSLHQNTGGRATAQLGAGDALSLLPQHERGTSARSVSSLAVAHGRPCQWIVLHTFQPGRHGPSDAGGHQQPQQGTQLL